MRALVDGLLVTTVLLVVVGCQQAPYDDMRAAWQRRERAAAVQTAALEEGRLEPNGGLAAAVGVPRLDVFAFELAAGTYHVGAVIRLTNLYLTGPPDRCTHFFFLSQLQPLTKQYVNLGDCTRAAIIARSAVARAIVAATPLMNAEIAPGYYKIYRVPELVGVVQPLPDAPAQTTLVVTRIVVEDQVVFDPGWG